MRESAASVRALMESQLNSLKQEFETFRQGHEEKHISVVNAAIQHRKELSDASISVVKAQVDAQFVTQQEQIRHLGEDMFSRFVASDLRYQQRYDAQTQAVQAAFDAQQEATQAALTAAREAVQAALAAAEKAIGKAETSTEKLIPRAEVEARIKDIVSQISAMETVSNRRLALLTEHYEKLRVLTDTINAIGPLTEAKFVTMRTLIDSQAEKVALALAASEKAIGKAETSTEKRFESVNEFRQQLNDQSHSFILRAEYQATLDAVNDKIDELRKTSNLGAGKSQGMAAGWGFLVGAIGLAAVVIGIILNLS